MNSDHYVPDPERETAELLDAYFSALADAIVSAELPDNLLAEIRARYAELLPANADRAVDQLGVLHLRTTLALVAAYQLLRPHLGRDPAIELIRTEFVEPLGAEMRQGTKAMLDYAPDPFAAMVATAKAREQDFFGTGFDFVHTADDGQRYYSDVHRCFYHDVLAANGTPELTPSMCAFDANWIEAIDPERHGFEFSRTTTIGLGGSHCPFHFRRRPSQE